MPIVSSTLDQEGAQRDGRRWVRETHTDHLGTVHEFGYLADEGLDAGVVMAGRVASIEAQLTAGEIAANLASVQGLGSEATVTLIHSTVAENRAALRAAYQVSTRFQAVMIGDYLSSLTDGQLRTLFGLTAGQVTTLRANRLTPAATTAAAIRAAAGA